MLSGDLSRGEAVRRLEARFAERMGVEDCVALSGARECLVRALRAATLPPGSGVLMTPITTAEMVRAVQWAGHRPILVDMDPKTLFFDVDALRAATGPGDRAILLTYLYGLVPSTLGEVLTLARDRGLLVIEDISQALGARFRGRPLGTLGDFGMTSLSSFKVCSSLSGGLLFGGRERVGGGRRQESGPARRPARGPFLALIAKILAHRVLTGDLLYPQLVFPVVRLLTERQPDLLASLQTGNVSRVLGLDRQAPAGNAPPPEWTCFTEAQARMALASLEREPAITEALIGQAERLASADGVASRLPERHVEGRSVFWRFPVRVSDARGVARRLVRLGVETSRNALPICSERPEFADTVFRGPHRGARRCHDEYLLIPIHAGFPPSRVEHVRRALAEALAGDAAPGGDRD